jgi:FkbM family methyltransferase
MTSSSTKFSLTAQDPQAFSGWLNKLFVLLQCTEWRGKHRFYLWCVKHFGHRLIAHKIDDRQFLVPLVEWCFWLEKGPQNYYLQEFGPFCQLLANLERPFTLFDLGADIGTVSSLVAAKCTNLNNVIAFEPNPRSFRLLHSNLKQMKCPTLAVQGAVSNFNGNASLTANLARVNDHEGHIVAGEEGDVTVVSLDQWIKEHSDIVLCETLVVKIDVEGQEQQVMAGALDMFKRAETLILLLEIHPDVLRDTHTTAEALFTQAEASRKFTWSVPAVGRQVDRSRYFFEQFDEIQYDVIGISAN